MHDGDDSPPAWLRHSGDETHLLREIMRAELSALPAGVDVVVRANPGAAEATFDELKNTLVPLCHRAIGRLEATR